MTTSTTNVSKSYLGDGIVTSFNTEFEFYDDSDLQVYIRTIATGAEVLKTLAVDYTVLGGDGLIGSVEMVVAPTGLEEIHIRRASPQDNPTDLVPVTAAPWPSVDSRHDRLTLQMQEVRKDFENRGLKIPVTDEDSSSGWPSMEIPNATQRKVANAVLGFDQVTGRPTIVTGATLPSVTVSAFGATLVDDADAAAARATLAAVGRGAQAGVLFFDTGTNAQRPAASTFGAGIFHETDTGRAFQSNGSVWLELGIGQFAHGSLPAAAAPAGSFYFDTSHNQLKRDNGSSLIEVQNAFPRGHLAGLQLSVSGNILTVQPGECRVDNATTTSVANATLSAAFTKDISAVWAAGTGLGGRASAVAYSTHTPLIAFLITQADGTVDVGVDNVYSGANLLADAGGSWPNLRRLGWVITDLTPNLRPFTQRGDHFRLTTPYVVFSDPAEDYGTAGQLEIIQAPREIPLDINWAMGSLADNEHIVIGDGASGIPAVPGTVTGLGTAGVNAIHRQQTDVDELFGNLWVATNPSGQIGIRVSVDTAVSPVSVVLNGWVDDRGRFN